MGKKKSPIADELDSLAGIVLRSNSRAMSTERLELNQDLIEQAEACRRLEQSVWKLTKWVVACWDEQVKDRPMRNVHRKALDSTWRQVYAKLTGKELPRPDAYQNCYTRKPKGGDHE